MTDFTMEKGADGVAVITWDVPGKSMNVLSMDGATTLNGLIDDALADDAVKGIVITSGKKDFAAGMDLKVIAGMKDANGAQGVFDGVMTLHHLLRKIELAGISNRRRWWLVPPGAVNGECVATEEERARAAAEQGRGID